MNTKFCLNQRPSFFRRFMVLTYALGMLLFVGCGGGEESTDGLTIGDTEVRAVRSNKPPVIERVRISPEQAVAGDFLEAEVVAEDPDGDLLSFVYTWRINGSIVGQEKSIRLVGVSRGDDVDVSVVATDQRAKSKPKRYSIVVDNRPPEIGTVGLRFSNEQDRSGDLVADVLAEDPDGDQIQLTYTWIVKGREVEGNSSNTLKTEGFRRGDRVRVVVVADDGEDRSDRFESPEIEMPNLPPVISSKPPTAFDSEGTYRYQVKAKDPDGDRTLRYSLDKSPAGMTIDSIFGKVQWKPTVDQVGNHEIVIVVKDQHGGRATQTFALNLSMGEEKKAKEGD